MRKLQKEIIVLKQHQISGMHTSKLLKIPKLTVFDAIKCFEELRAILIVLEKDKKICTHQKMIKNLYFDSKHPNQLWFGWHFQKLVSCH